MKIIILAAGAGTRWNNYLGGPKYLPPVDGEPILHRTKRLLNERGQSNIIVSGVDVPIYPNELEIDRFYGTRHLWEENNLFLYGDCYYTEHAIDTILKHKGLMFFGRRGRTKIKKWSEIFGIRFNNDEILKSLEIVRQKYISGEIKRCIGWELYRQLMGIDLKIHKITTNFVDINDITDDFDSPEEYDLWIKMYNSIKPQQVFYELHKYNPRKILHIGCHYCMEADIYRMNNWDCVLVDADSYYISTLKNRGYKAICEVISDNPEVDWYEYDNDQHNSVLMRRDKSSKSGNSTKRKTKKMIELQDDCDTLVLDVQGSEKDVLSSGDLNRFNTIIVESSKNPRYIGEADYDQIKIYLENNGFNLIQEFRHGGYDIYDLVFVKMSKMSGLGSP
jgi:hypothetical protein